LHKEQSVMAEKAVHPQAQRLTRRSFLWGAAGAGLAALSGCSSGGGGGALGGGGAGGGKVTELVVPTNKSPWLNAYKKVAAQYQEQHGIRITLREFPYDGLRTQQVNAVQRKNFPFDVFQLDEPWTGQFYDSGWVTPLKQIDASFGLDPEVLTYDSLPFWDKAQRTSAAGGDLVGLPLNGNVDLFIYRKDLYDELGLKVPTTWDEAAANARAGQQSGKIRYGHIMRTQAAAGGAATTYEFMHIFYSYGANWFVDEGKDWTPAVNTPEAVAATETYKQLAQLGHAQPQTIGQAEAIALMQGGQALQTHVVAAAAADLVNPDKSQVADKLGFAVVPAGAAGKPTPTSGVWSLCIPAGLAAERAQAALGFIGWMLSRETQLAFTQNGGIPTRRDTYGASGLPATTASYLPAVGDSTPHARRHIRYVFAAAMLEVTERTLGQINAGTLAVKAGLDQMQRELTKVVRDAGFLK
jgi:multiple sugar transport system substrate-binding protein